MVLTRDELSRSLQHEIKILLHLASKLEPGMLDYRPTPKQRSALEFLVSFLLSGYAAYRTQLFLYLKACGREELGTINLWDGADPPTRG
jgi:hypothetical protein